MNVRDVMCSLDGRLDDVRREHAWRGITRRLAATPQRTYVWHWWLLVPGVLAIATAIALLVVRSPATSSAPRASWRGAVLAVGQQRVVEHAGVRITVVAPGLVTVADDGDGIIHVEVTAGTVIADRTLDAGAVAMKTGGSTVVTYDRRFAVRVEPGRVVLGSGEHARQIVESQTLVDHPDVARPDVGPPPPATAPPLRPAPPRPPTAAVLYQRAESALTAHDTRAARGWLERIIRDDATDPLVDAARYDLALLAVADHDQPRARALLDAILASGHDATVRAAAEALRARVTADE